eukprot:9064943-Lingulodinium_polyedra.AAC.1
MHCRVRHRELGQNAANGMVIAIGVEGQLPSNTGKGRGKVHIELAATQALGLNIKPVSPAHVSHVVNTTCTEAPALRLPAVRRK